MKTFKTRQQFIKNKRILIKWMQQLSIPTRNIDDFVRELLGQFIFIGLEFVYIQLCIPNYKRHKIGNISKNELMRTTQFEISLSRSAYSSRLDISSLYKQKTIFFDKIFLIRETSRAGMIFVLLLNSLNEITMST